MNKTNKTSAWSDDRSAWGCWEGCWAVMLCPVWTVLAHRRSKCMSCGFGRIWLGLALVLWEVGPNVVIPLPSSWFSLKQPIPEIVWEWVGGGQGGKKYLEEAFSSFSEQTGRTDFAWSTYGNIWLALLHARGTGFLWQTDVTRQLSIQAESFCSDSLSTLVFCICTSPSI